MKPVSVIIPAFNEAERIPRVLLALRDIPYLEKIIVVDDGSTDTTSAVVNQMQVEDPRIQLIRHDRNWGKGQAVFLAWEQIQTPYLLMLDADLKGLSSSHVDALCEPVMNGQAEMTLGLFRKGHLATDFSHWIAPWLTGQRCMIVEIMGNISNEAARGYGLETALTVLSHQMHYKVRRVYLLGMSHPPSEFHRGSICGSLNRLKMYLQITKAWIVASGRKPEIRLKNPQKNNNN